jgi:two-component system chemotaxis sensor kinase CheA
MGVRQQKFHDAFIDEGLESLHSMEAALLELVIGAPDLETINRVFRVAHSIKGTAGMFGFNEIASFTHTLEALLGELRAGRMQVTSPMLDLLLKSVDLLRDMMGAVQRKAPIDQQAVVDLQFDLEQLVASSNIAVDPSASTLGSTGIYLAKPMGGDTASIRVSTGKLDALAGTVGEIVAVQSALADLGREFDGDAGGRLRAALAELGRHVGELQRGAMRVRMLPISALFSPFPRLVRDLSLRLGKQIQLQVTGEQIELDKAVLEKLGDPLMHLVRNSIDHGIEMPRARAAAGKPAAGQVRIDVRNPDGTLTVEVSDDGGGLDYRRILAKARGAGLVSALDLPSIDDMHALIFMPGFTTAEQASEVSGRGVGMDVVRRNITDLGGSIEVRSEPGKGSRFIITVPPRGPGHSAH